MISVYPVFVTLAIFTSSIAANEFVRSDEWELGGSYTSTTHYDDMIWSYDNPSEDLIVVVPCTCSAITTQKVWGSAESPPWTSKFTPLHDDYTPFEFNANVTIDPRTRHVKYISYDRETGSEDWLNTKHQYGVIRYRRWDSNGAITFQVFNL